MHFGQHSHHGLDVTIMARSSPDLQTRMTRWTVYASRTSTERLVLNLKSTEILSLVSHPEDNRCL